MLEPEQSSNAGLISQPSSEQGGRDPEQRRLPVHVAGVARAGQVILKIIFLPGAHADIGDPRGARDESARTREARAKVQIC